MKEMEAKTENRYEYRKPQEKRKQMIAPDLFEFAYVPDWYGHLAELERLALPESWKFRKPSRETKNADTPILERYIHTIFRKQVIDFNSESDPRKADSIFHLENECVCFHTGLYTPQYKGIYGYFERNNFSDSLRDWYFRGFCDELSPKLRYIEPLPQKPVYHMAQSVINFNPEWPIRVNVNHILGDEEKLERIPAKIRKVKNLPLLFETVSTDSRRQEDSLENQMETYERLITGNPEYEFIGVFADQGISGYCENRPQFQRMMEKARAGEIDLIITKSISRFARNTVTVLKFARELKELGVGIFFEEKNINTLSGDGEMMLAVLASFAQEESRSMSENNKWSIRKKFERGEVMITTSRFLGYDKNEYGDLIVNRKEAEIVSLTFDLYLRNVGSSRIGELLDYLGVKTVTGTTWESGTINGMLCNEKYKGDFHLQKYYTTENKRNHTRKNNGEVQSYYISENHEPIVSPEVWEKVQEVREQRKRDRNIGQDSTMKFQNRYPLSGMLICPYCGKTLRRRQVYKKKIQWLCSTYIEKGVKACKGIRIDDAELQGLNITEQTVIEEVVKNGKKHYCYTSKADFDCGIRNSTVSAEIEDGSVLPSVNRPRRTVIKL